MPFYTYVQNNSGGYFEGPKYVIVEADTHREADRRAVDEADLYFDGVESGTDCDCCGDRWTRAWELDAEDSPLIYGKPAETYGESVRVYRKS